MVMKPASIQSNIRRIISLFLVFAVIVNLLYVPLYFYLYKTLYSSELSRYNQKMQDGVSRLNTTLSALIHFQAIAYSDESNRSIAFLNTTGDQLAVHAMKNLLSNYLNSHNLVWEAGVTWEDSVLFSRHQIYGDKVFLQPEQYLNFEPYSVSSLVSSFHGKLCSPGVVSVTSSYYGNYPALILAFQWSSLHNVYLFAALPVSLLEDILTFSSANRQVQIDLAIGNDEWILANTVSHGEPCEVLTSETVLPQIHVTLSVPKRLIAESMQPFSLLLVFFLVLLLIACVLSIFFLSRKASRPFETLASSLLSAHNTQLDPALRLSPEEIASAVQHMDRQIDDYQSVFKAHIMEKAIYKGFSDTEEYQQFCTFYPDFPSHWQLCWLQADQEDAVGKALSLHSVEEKLRQLLPKCILLPANVGSLICILADREEYRKKLSDFVASVPGLLPPVFTAIYSDIQDLPRAEQEAEISATAQIVSGNQALPYGTSFYPITIQKLQNMYAALMQGDEEFSRSLLQSCVDELQKKPDVFMEKISYHLIVDMLVLVKLQSNVNLNAVPIPRYQPYATEKLFGALKQCFQDICRVTKKSYMHSLFENAENVVEWIKDHLRDPNLSISYVCENLAISPSTLQKYLKLSTDKSFFAFVEEQRMTQIRLALQTTSKTVEEVAAEYGYDKVNTFYKAYKRYYNESPSKIRDSNENR